jgi:predicted nucleotidyltransferase
LPPELTKDQIEDIREIRDLCGEFKADFVIIGAIAYKLYFPDEDRFTADIDATIALDLDKFWDVARRLEELDWKQDAAQEQRWRGRRGSYFDILPAGSELRQAKQVVWPKSQFAMSLVGFDHVFARAVSHRIAPDFFVKTIPPVVLTLTKIVSFMDDPQRRSKDLTDIRSLLDRYEEGADRIFEDVVFEARLPDIGLANAFLLGLDLAEICSPDEFAIVQRFVYRLQDQEDPFASKVAAFKRGLLQSKSGAHGM